MGIPKKFYPYLAIIVGVSMMGISPLMIRYADAPGPVTAFYRLLISTIILAIPFFKAQKKNGRYPANEIKIAAFAGIFFAIDIAAYATGVVIGGPTIPTLMSNTSPIWVGLGTLWIFKQKLPLGFWGGLAVALAGVVLVMGGNFQITDQASLGAWLGLVAAVFYGAYYLLIQKSREKMDALSVFWISAFVSTIGLGIIVMLLGQSFIGYSTQTYWIFLATSLGPQIIGMLSINYALGHLPASVVTPSLLGQPIIAGILAVPIFGEMLGFNQIAGGVVILLGIFLVHRSKLSE